MDANLNVKFDSGIVRVAGDGVLSSPVGAQMMRLASECAQTHGAHLYLYDLRRMAFRDTATSIYNRPKLALALGISRCARTALLVLHIDDIFRFIEDVASNRGFVIRVFTGEDDALAWLHDTTPPLQAARAVPPPVGVRR